MRGMRGITGKGNQSPYEYFAVVRGKQTEVNILHFATGGCLGISKSGNAYDSRHMSPEFLPEERPYSGV